MKDKLKELAQARKKVTEAEAIVAEYKLLLGYNDLYLAYLLNVGHLQEAKEMADGLAAQIKSDAVAGFSETAPDKHPYPGVEIKDFPVFKITDEKAALKWAGENAPACVTLNEAKFKKVADALDLPFVTKSIEHRAQIASDLSEYLDEQ